MIKYSKSPLKWMGGKFQQANQIIRLFPYHRCYVEVFGGAGHVIFAKNPNTSKVEVYNDINDELVNFFMTARDHTEELIERLDTLPYSRALYQKWKKEPLPDNLIERACRWFYILHSSFAAKYGAGWAYSKVRNHAQSFIACIDRINNVRTRFKNVLIECIDFRQIIDKYDSKDTLFYLDPSYLGQKSNENYYGKTHNKVSDFSEQDHRDLAELLNNIKGKAIISYYPVDLIKELYPEGKWHWLLYSKILHSQKAVKDTKKDIAEEVIFMNFPWYENLFTSAV